MTILTTGIEAKDKRFRENAAAMAELVSELKQRMTTAALGGDERSRKRHTDRGKLLPRERV